MCLFVVSQYCETGSASKGPTCSSHGNQTRENVSFKKVLMPFLVHLQEADMLIFKFFSSKYFKGARCSPSISATMET